MALEPCSVCLNSPLFVALGSAEPAESPTQRSGLAAPAGTPAAQGAAAGAASSAPSTPAAAAQQLVVAATFSAVAAAAAASTVEAGLLGPRPDPAPAEITTSPLGREGSAAAAAAGAAAGDPLAPPALPTLTLTLTPLPVSPPQRLQYCQSMPAASAMSPAAAAAGLALSDPAVDTATKPGAAAAAASLGAGASGLHPVLVRVPSRAARSTDAPADAALHVSLLSAALTARAGSMPHDAGAYLASPTQLGATGAAPSTGRSRLSSEGRPPVSHADAGLSGTGGAATPMRSPGYHSMLSASPGGTYGTTLGSSGAVASPLVLRALPDTAFAAVAAWPHAAAAASPVAGAGAGPVGAAAVGPGSGTSGASGASGLPPFSHGGLPSSLRAQLAGVSEQGVGGAPLQQMEPASAAAAALVAAGAAAGHPASSRGSSEAVAAAAASPAAAAVAAVGGGGSGGPTGSGGPGTAWEQQLHAVLFQKALYVSFVRMHAYGRRQLHVHACLCSRHACLSVPHCIARTVDK